MKSGVFGGHVRCFWGSDATTLVAVFGRVQNKKFSAFVYALVVAAVFIGSCAMHLH